jgi:hypothetical protein
VTSGELSQLMIPTTENMTMMLPTVAGDQNDQHNPFPSGLVYIGSIDDKVFFTLRSHSISPAFKIFVSPLLTHKNEKKLLPETALTPMP